MPANRVVNVTEFKAKCLSLFDEVESGKVSITVTRRGKPVAVINPPAKKAFKSSKGMFAGKMQIVGDIINTNFEWDPLAKFDELYPK